MPVTLIKSTWSSGSLIFHESTSIAPSTTYNVLALATDAVTVGDTANDVDFEYYATGSLSAIIDCGAATFTLTGISLVTNGAITTTYAGTALNITSTITSADNVAEVLATSTATSGASCASKSTLTVTGNGKSYAIAKWIELSVGGNTQYCHGIYIYTGTVANKTITQYAPIYIYCDDMGTAVEHQAGISINRNITNVGTASDCFLQMRNHGSTAATAFIKATGTATYLLDFQNGDLGVPLSEASDSVNCSHKLAVKMPDGTARYLHLFTD